MFPYVLYLDAGMRVLSPLDIFFECINENGYFLIEAGGDLHGRITTYVTKQFELDKTDRTWVLDNGLSAGFMGVSQKVKDNFILPIFNLTYSLDYFKDDGTAIYGFGEARHDLILFSIYAQLNHLKIYRFNQKIKINNKLIPLKFNKRVRFWAEIENINNVRKKIIYK